MRLPSSSATKRSAEQKADFVPGHKIGKLGQLRFIKGAAWVGGGLVNARIGRGSEILRLCFLVVMVVAPLFWSLVVGISTKCRTPPGEGGG